MKFAIITALLLTTAITTAHARENIQVAGSSTVLPYASIVAEAFGENTGFPTPTIESGGSSAGLKKFCEGIGENTIDIANASRKIKDSEIAVCAENGVTDIIEVRIGYDGIVFASQRNGADFTAFTPAQIYQGLAAQIVIDGVLVTNPYNKWSEIDPSLPNVDILAFVPGTKHGTREVFETKVVEEGCKVTGAADVITATLGEDKVFETCVGLRTDGRSIDIDGDYTETLARLASNDNAIGVFGLSFYENNTDILKVTTIDGVEPSTETIASGEYPVSRPLYFYIKKAHIGVVPGLKEFAQFFISDEIAGPAGPLAQYGLVADPELAKTQTALENEEILQ